MPPPLADYRVLTFDCYGTLIDWETGIWDALQPLLMAGDLPEITRSVALGAFSHHESSQEAETPRVAYSQILTMVHRRLAENFGLPTTGDLDEAFGDSVPHWPAFPDTADALRYLQTRYRLEILSNIDRRSFSASNRKLGVEFDAIYTAEAIGSYNPDPANFEYLLSHLETDLGLSASQVLHTAQSLFHDHAPAKRFGLSTAWIDRQRLSEGGDWGATAEVKDRPTPDHSFFTLAEMANEIRRW